MLREETRFLRLGLPVFGEADAFSATAGDARGKAFVDTGEDSA